MEVIEGFAAASDEPRAIALGHFDGVHLGHRAVCLAALERGREMALRAAAVTFRPHPAAVLRPDLAPLLISSQRDKIRLLAELGLDELIVIPFDRNFSVVTAEEFCREILAGGLKARFVAVGQNFRFGHRARGDTRFLAQEGERLGFRALAVDLVEVDGAPVSSTRIRRLVAAGDVAGAARLLGRPYEFRGDVVHGARRGREIGFPTANLEPTPGLVVPARGIYAATTPDGRPVAVNVGTRPVFEDEGRLLVEAHLIDRHVDLYGRELSIQFIERLRDERDFESVAQLISQIERDIARVRTIVAGLKQAV